MIKDNLKEEIKQQNPYFITKLKPNHLQPYTKWYIWDYESKDGKCFSNNNSLVPRLLKLSVLEYEIEYLYTYDNKKKM